MGGGPRKVLHAQPGITLGISAGCSLFLTEQRAGTDPLDDKELLRSGGLNSAPTCGDPAPKERET